MVITGRTRNALAFTGSGVRIPPSPLKPQDFSCGFFIMFTDKDYRRQGTAREILTRAVNEGRKFGCGTIQITESDMGEHLYLDFGFVKNGDFMQYKL